MPLFFEICYHFWGWGAGELMQRGNLCTYPEMLWVCTSETGRSTDKGASEMSLLLSLTLGKKYVGVGKVDRVTEVWWWCSVQTRVVRAVVAVHRFSSGTSAAIWCWVRTFEKIWAFPWAVGHKDSFTKLPFCIHLFDFHMADCIFPFHIVPTFQRYKSGSWRVSNSMFLWAYLSSFQSQHFIGT